MNKVGQMLREQREKLNISIEEVSNKTKIQPIYLDAIEKGDFAFFKNQEFYQQIFVGSYAKFLGLDKNELLDQLVEDNNEYLLNPSKDGFAPKFAAEIIDKQQDEEAAEETLVETVVDDVVVDEVVEQPEPVLQTEANPHSNPHILEKYMYQVEDPKLKEIEEQIKAKKEAAALRELEADELLEPELTAVETITTPETPVALTQDTNYVDAVMADALAAEIDDLVAQADAVATEIMTEEPVAGVEETVFVTPEAIVTETEVSTDEPVSEINIDFNEPTLEEIALENSQTHDISSLLDEIENDTLEEVEELSVGEIIDETNNTTIESPSELEDVLASLNKKTEIEEEQALKEVQEAETILEEAAPVEEVVTITAEETAEPTELTVSEPIILSDLDHVSTATGNTEVIDLTSGIDIERISETERVQEDNDIFKNLDETLAGDNSTPKEERKLADTGIDLKVAKALGENNIDKADLKRKKVDRIINIIFIVIVVGLACWVTYLIINGRLW